MTVIFLVLVNALSSELLIQITRDFVCSHLASWPQDQKVSVMFVIFMEMAAIFWFL